MLNEDYRDMLHAFSDEKARFLLVGAYASPLVPTIRRGNAYERLRATGLIP